MKTCKHFPLLKIALIVLAAVTVCSCNRDTVYCLGGEDNDLIDLLTQEGFNVVLADDANILLDEAPEGAAVLMLASSYPEKVTKLSREQMDKIGKKNLRVYAEFATASDTLPEITEAELERVVVTDSMAPDLKPMDLLSVNRCRYFREDSVETPALSLAKVAGFDTAFYGLEDTPYSPLAYKKGNVWFTTSKLSDFAKLRFMPEFRWQTFWEHLMGDLLGKEVKFSKWPGFIRPSYSETAVLPSDARRKSVEKGVEWFFNGHFLVHPDWKDTWVYKYQGDGMMPVGPSLPDDAPDGDGSLGVLEGHCSAIYSDGRQAYRYWMRDDVQGEASMTFAIAGELCDNADYRKIAANIADYSFREFRSGARNDPESPSYGLLSWAITPYARDIYYGDDNARSILGAIMCADVLKENRWNSKIVEAVLANFRTTGSRGFRGERLEEADMQKNGWRYYRDRDLVNPHPHFESWIWACYLWLYRQTGYEPLYEMAEKGIAATMEAYPDNWSWTNGIQQEKARMILPLAWLYRVKPTAQHKEWLGFMVNEFLKNQVECGAVREELGNASNGMFGRCKSNEAYGKEEAPLIFDNGDPIADMLYTCNFAFFGLNEAACATGDPCMKEAVEKMSDFLTRIQVRSDRFKNVDGAWFRAFNYRNWDYWASNADAGWGAQSTLTGWIQSWIVTTQALMEMNTSYWDKTAGSSIGKNESAIFRSMLETD